MSKIDFKNFIQIAGVIDQKEADLITENGVNFLGFPLRLPINKEDLTEKEAAQIIKKLNPPQYGVIISYSSTASEAIELCNQLNASIIQLHGSITIEELIKLKKQRPDITIIKSLVIGEGKISTLKKSLKEIEEYVDAFITDTFDTKTGASGATGKTHDWNISKEFVNLSQKPVILAGGINHENVYTAIKFVKPSGVDVHTGIENSSGRKDENLLQQFLSESNKAFNEIGI